MSITTININRKQIEQLQQIVDHFPEITNFTLVCDHSSGIGPAVSVKFTLFDSNDAKVDITDYSTW